MNDNVIIEYIPPTRWELLDFSRQVCKRMNIPESDTETVRGLCDFLVVASRIKAKQMSIPSRSDE